MATLVIGKNHFTLFYYSRKRIVQPINPLISECAVVLFYHNKVALSHQLSPSDWIFGCLRIVVDLKVETHAVVVIFVLDLKSYIVKI